MHGGHQAVGGERVLPRRVGGGRLEERVERHAVRRVVRGAALHGGPHGDAQRGAGGHQRHGQARRVHGPARPATEQRVLLVGALASKPSVGGLIGLAAGTAVTVGATSGYTASRHAPAITLAPSAAIGSDGRATPTLQLSGGF